MNVSAKGAELFYSTNGQGPACLFPCGIGTRPYERQTPPPLTTRLRLAYVDLRGSGRSTGEPTDLTFDVFAEDMEAIRIDLGVDRVAVLGHSILGLLAIEYARRFPARVSHIIAVGTPPIGDMSRVSAAADLFFEKNASEERKRILRESLERLPAGASLRQGVLARTPTRFFDPHFDAASLYVDSVSKPELLLHVLGKLAPAWDVTVAAASLRVPIFLALGRHDYVVPHTLWDGIAEKLPRVRVEVFERSGHQPFFEEPERFTDVVTEWMAGPS